MNVKSSSNNSKTRRSTCRCNASFQTQKKKKFLIFIFHTSYFRLVCSDLISRGIDISHDSHVVSYDVPVDMRKYVHRVGRTARAGKTGEAWTLVEEQEVLIFYSYLPVNAHLPRIQQARYFKQMLKEAGRLEKVKRLRISDEDLAPLTPHYEVRNLNIVKVWLFLTSVLRLLSTS